MYGDKNTIEIEQVTSRAIIGVCIEGKIIGSVA